ncbi:MAG TPA: SHOCT domain-containing protein [Candidatus Deferrimicrobium sp.]|nr:SHOCT domain-containing protein [Candidatus Deferrimicrobium sp.]
MIKQFTISQKFHCLFTNNLRVLDIIRFVKLSAQKKYNQRKGQEKMMGRFNAGHLGGLASTGGYWWVGLVAMAIKFVFWIVIVVLAYRVVKSLAVNYHHTKRLEDNKALTILRERYAKGEIDTEEFNTRKNALQ